MQARAAGMHELHELHTCIQEWSVNPPHSGTARPIMATPVVPLNQAQETRRLRELRILAPANVFLSTNLPKHSSIVFQLLPALCSATKGVDLDRIIRYDWLSTRRSHQQRSNPSKMRRSATTPAHLPSPLRYLPQSPSMSAATLLVAAAVFVPVALGHDHSPENIEEGQTISVDPIVRSMSHPTTAPRCRDGDLKGRLVEHAQKADKRPCRTAYYGLISSSRCLPLGSCSQSAWFSA